ncbi:MAG: rhamnulokinase family protein [Rectinemataceae bacterium]|jgi:rhamnulokinase
MTGNHLAIDLGAESGRAIVGSIRDGRVVLEELHRFSTGCTVLNGHLVVDVYRIFEEILESLKKYSRSYGPELESVGVDAWGSDFGLADECGNMIGLPMFYRDGRTEGVSEVVESGIGYRRLHELTNHRRTSTGSLHQIIAMERDERQSLLNARAILFIGDIFNYFLSGKICSEHSVASYSQMFSLRKNAWEDEVFEAFRIPTAIQSSIVHPGDFLGPLTAQVSAAVGLGGARVIAPAVHDTGDAVLAVPAEGVDWAFISSGTWSLLGIECDSPIVNEYSYEGNFSNSGLAFGKVLFKISIAGLWIIQQCRKRWNGNGVEIDYAEIAEAAEKAPPFRAFIDPEADDFFNPADMPGAISGFVERSGQGRVDSGDVGQIARIVYESLALRYRQGIEMTQVASGRRIGRIHIVGGGSNVDLLNRFTASASGLSVIAGPSESTAIGNVMIQAYGCGEVASIAEIRKIVKESFPPRVFEPQNIGPWREHYDEFLGICKLK